ncbi:MAG: UDP-N-acetylglucosamine 2-epimerase (non-hydrolyzing) [Nitrospira sp.]|nr:UDP-N-acetylglucosamine 2-epimerase (non-hydrolyzing) [Candidatus Brocadiales bacterium]MBL7048853.1 UDP-N-acetylglucosamine 2-epimerase (non-hydrolyzing) [Nitrospira sp.]
MKKRVFKVIVVIGTRPEAIKMCPVVYELKQRKSFKTVVLVTGQHKEMLDQVLKVFKVKPDYNLSLMEVNQSLSTLTAKAIPAMERVLKDEQPDMVLVQGDTTTSFVASLAAFYQHVNIGHIESGLRTYNKYSPFPEEMNRKLITALSDINFAPTKSAAANLKVEGIDGELIHITGNTVVDALFYTLNKVKKKYKKIYSHENRLILMTAHRRENFGKPMEDICKAVNQLVDEYEDIEVVYPVHKNPNVREVVYERLSNKERIHLIEPVDYIDFVNLLNDAYIILTDSGGIQEEAPSLGKPVLVLRNETERPEAVKAGTVKIVGTDTENIVRNSKILLDNKNEYKKMANAINPYGDGTASTQIVSLIESFLSK